MPVARAQRASPHVPHQSVTEHNEHGDQTIWTVSAIRRPPPPAAAAAPALSALGDPSWQQPAVLRLSVMGGPSHVSAAVRPAPSHVVPLLSDRMRPQARSVRLRLRRHSCGEETATSRRQLHGRCRGRQQWEPAAVAREEAGRTMGGAGKGSASQRQLQKKACVEGGLTAAAGKAQRQTATAAPGETSLKRYLLSDVDSWDRR